MRTWLQHAVTAGRIVGDRPDLWIAGALAWLAYGGLLVFLGAVVPFPSLADVAFFTADIAVSGSALPALVLGASLLVGFLALLVLHAVGDSVAIGQLDGRRGWLAPAGELLAVHLVASVPVAAAGLLLAWRLAVVGPAEYQSPNIGGPLALRIAAGVLPELLLTLVVLIAAQAIAAGAAWRVAGRGRAPLAGALPGGARAAWRRPWRHLGVALVTLLAHVVYGALVFLLLRLLYAPIGAFIGAGDVRDIAVVSLLVGFVAIWLCLVLGGGALHAWASAWWAGELESDATSGARAPDTRPEAGDGTQQHEGASL